MSNQSLNLLNSIELGLTQFTNRHHVLGESFALPNMSWGELDSAFKFTTLDFLSSTPFFLGVSSAVQQKKGYSYV